MRNALGEGTVVGYCTNVHAGASWAEMRSNLDRYAVGVKKRVSPDAPMGIGLWLSAQSARDVLRGNGVSELDEFLRERGLFVFTLNGFPYGDFHGPVVKHKVYKPDWGERERFEFTLDLVAILSELLPEEAEGSISTLPLGWGKEGATEVNLDRALTHLVELADRLQEVEIETGKSIHVDLEPEPGCYLDRSEDVVSLFEELLKRGDRNRVRRYIRVCHDVCHSAVMFEDQKRILDRYRSAGILIGKAQISSAVKVPFEEMDTEGRVKALEQLRGFQEDRYLHQTVIQDKDGTRFFEDLPVALQPLAEGKEAPGEWRVHFHVPIFLESAGCIGVTQDQILEGLPLLLEYGVKHFEVETYAWNVLPEYLRTLDLSEGIAREIEWLISQAPR